MLAKLIRNSLKQNILQSCSTKLQLKIENNTQKCFQEILKRLETQELENTRQATVISKLEEALISSDQKCKQEVQETGKNNSLLEFLFPDCRHHTLELKKINSIQ